MQKAIPMLCVTDVPGTIDWYTSLGFTVQQRQPEDGKGEIEFALLRSGDVELMVQPRGDRPGDGAALWFYTDRLDEMHKKMKQAHPAARVLEEMYEPFYGGRQFSVTDASGVETVFYDPSG